LSLSPHYFRFLTTRLGLWEFVRSVATRQFTRNE